MSNSSAAPTASPGFDVTSLDSSGAFVKHAGLILDAINETRVAGHIDLTAAHHTPWGIVHGGVEAAALYQGRTHQLWRVEITDESGGLIAHGEVRLQNIASRSGE